MRSGKSIPSPAVFGEHLGGSAAISVGWSDRYRCISAPRTLKGVDMAIDIEDWAERFVSIDERAARAARHGRTERRDCRAIANERRRARREAWA